MLDNNYKNIVDKKEALIIVLDSNDNILFQSNTSPLSSFCKKVFGEGINGKGLKIYSNQLGIGLAELSKVIDVQYYYGTDISAPSKNILDKYNIKYDFTNIVDLVKSSGNPDKVCPVELKLSSMDNVDEKLDFLKIRAQQSGSSCVIN